MPNAVWSVANATPGPTNAARVARNTNTNASSLAPIKAAPGRLYGGSFTNVGGSVAYLKVYDKATSVVLASDVPFLVLPVPAGANVPLQVPTPGIGLANGLVVLATANLIDTDTTALTANTLVGYVAYA